MEATLSLGGRVWESNQNGPTRPNDHFSRFLEQTWPKAFAQGTPTIVAPKSLVDASDSITQPQTPVQRHGAGDSKSID